MKKRLCMAVALLAAFTLAGCHGIQLNKRSSGAESAETGEDARNMTLTDVIPTEKITELEEGLSAVRYEGNYGFDQFLSGGGASTDKEVIGFLTGNLLGDSDLGFAGEVFGCSTVTAKNAEGGNHLNHAKLIVDLYRLKRNEKKSANAIKTIQEKKLRKLLFYAWEHSDYYRRTFTDAGITEDQLSTLPLSAFPSVNKKILMEYFNELVTVRDVKQEELRHFDAKESMDRKTFRNYHVVHSSGSTGKPGYFIYNETAWNQMLLGIIRGALWGMSMMQILGNKIVLISDGE